MSALKPFHQANAPTYFFAGAKMKMHLTGAQTGGSFCMLESVVPPGHQTPPHVHDDEDEAFLILEGELDIVVGGETITVREGEAAFAPRGVPHQLRNVSSRPVRGIVVATSSGFGDFVQAAGIPATSDVPPTPDPARLVQEAGRFGIKIAA